MPGLLRPVCLSFFVRFRVLPFSEPKIATIQSCEDAAWESDLPTTPGSELLRFLKLRTGLASIQFRSGANLILEGPAEVNLISPMKTHLVSGMAIVEVPESAIGFVLKHLMATRLIMVPVLPLP